MKVGPQNANPVLVMSESASSQTVGTVTGAVALAGGEPGDAAGVQIALAGSSYSAVSASDGAFTIGNINPGVYSLVCTMAGYKKLQKDNLQINPGEKRDLGVLTLQRDIVMPKVIRLLPPTTPPMVLINYVVPVTITFNKSMNSDTLLQSVGITPRVSSTISMITSSQGKPQATLQIQLQNNNPSTALRYYTTYQITVGTGATDSEGNNMEEPYTFSFTTGGLRILFTQPAQNRLDATFLEYTPVIVRFNGRLDPNTVNYRNITISPSPFAVTPSMEMIGDQNTGWSEIRMTNGLAFSKTYTFAFGPGLQTMGRHEIAGCAPAPAIQDSPHSDIAKPLRQPQSSMKQSNELIYDTQNQSLRGMGPGRNGVIDSLRRAARLSRKTDIPVGLSEGRA